MKGKSVFLSRLIDPEDAARAEATLRQLDPTVIFTDSPDDSPTLRIATISEIMSDSSSAVSITPLCLSQMAERQLDPFALEWKCSLVNLFLWQKTVSIVFFDEQTTARLAGMVERMGGVRKDDRADYIVSSRTIEMEGSPIVVRACWIDSLFGAKKFVSFEKFTFGRIEKDYPATQIVPARLAKHASFSLSQNPSKGRKSSPRVGSLKLSSKSGNEAKQMLLPFVGAEDIKPSQSILSGKLKRSQSTKSQSKPKLKLTPVTAARSNSRVEDFFKTSGQSSQMSGSGSQVGDLGTRLSPLVVDDSESEEESELSVKLPGELPLEKQQKKPVHQPAPRKTKKSHLKDEVADFFARVRDSAKPKKVMAKSEEVAQTEMEEVDFPQVDLPVKIQSSKKKPQVLHRLGGIDLDSRVIVSDSDISSESDEELRRAIRGVKSTTDMKLDSLCHNLMKAKPNQSRFLAEPPSDDKDALLNELSSFSQIDESQHEDDRPAFNIPVEYERDHIHTNVVVKGGRDPLLDLFEGSQMSQA